MKKTISLMLLITIGCATPYDTVPPADPVEIDGLGVLVFTKIAGFRHPSTADGVIALKELGATRDWTVIHTENGAAFNAAYLSNFDVVVWLNTTWDVLNAKQEQAFETYIENGGGYLGVHAAADTEYDWSWYGETLLGTWFNNHPNFPNVRSADVVIEVPDHPATAGLPARWTREDEWYNFQRSPRDQQQVQVLATLDENSYDPGPGGMGDHPIIWCQEIGNGRMFYTGLGHTTESYEDPLFLNHLAAGIEWAGHLID